MTTAGCDTPTSAWGLASSGNIAAPSSRPGVEVVGVSDVNQAAADERAEELGCPAFADHRAMFASTRPDVVVITTPHPFPRRRIPHRRRGSPAAPHPRSRPRRSSRLERPRQWLRPIGGSCHSAGGRNTILKTYGVRLLLWQRSEAGGDILMRSASSPNGAWRSPGRASGTASPSSTLTATHAERIAGATPAHPSAPDGSVPERNRLLRRIAMRSAAVLHETRLPASPDRPGGEVAR